jgi:hypothetical protein
MMPAGSINGWQCDKCHRLTIAIHRDEGVTPFMLACRADGYEPRSPESTCDGMGVSCGYPVDPPPCPPEWEFFRPSKSQMKRYKREDPAMYEHCIKGGLELRRLQDA